MWLYEGFVVLRWRRYGTAWGGKGGPGWCITCAYQIVMPLFVYRIDKDFGGTNRKPLSSISCEVNTCMDLDE